LIDQLGSTDFAERERAGQMLRARGPSVLPQLRKARTHADAEVRRRVQALIASLEVAIALEPKRVTIKPEVQALSAILKEIEKQTGYAVKADTNVEQRYQVHINDMTFWDALERIEAVTGFAVVCEPLESGIQLKRRDDRPPFVVVKGPFRLEASRFHEDRDIDFTRRGKDKEVGRRSHLLTLTVSVLAEPRFILLSVEKARVDVALDEEKKSLGSPPPEDGQRDSLRVIDLFRADFQHTSDILLQRSSEKARTIKTLRGVIPVQVVAERKPLVVTEKVLEATGKKFQIGESSLEITQAEKSKDGTYHFRLAVPPDASGVHIRWHDRVHLEDAKGHRYEPHGLGDTHSGGIHEIMLDYAESKDPAVGPPSKLLVEDWIIVHHPIPFEFKDVPLP
jgi:hypothetical protein